MQRRTRNTAADVIVNTDGDNQYSADSIRELTAPIIAGRLFMPAYAVHLRNLTLMAAFSLNVLVYVRNLHLICPIPSVSTTSRSTGTFSKTSTFPPSQRTSMRSARSRRPRPKYSRVP